MTLDAATLLKALGSGMHPAAPIGAASPGTSQAAIGAGQFADLLDKARSGLLSSNKPVSIASEIAGRVTISEDDLARIALAADKAEAAGVRTALVVLDDQQVVLDIADRKITGLADLGDSGVIAGIDGVINLSSRLGKQDAGAAPVPTPAPTINNPSLLSLLASNKDRESAA